MTIKTLIDTLRSATKLLHAIDSILVQTEQSQNTNSDKKPDAPKATIYKASSDRAMWDVLIADVAVATCTVSQYQKLSSGIPLPFTGIDHYDNEDLSAIVRTFLDSQQNGMSGLEGLLRSTGEEEVSDVEVLNSYRALGCQKFVMWEISIHRQVASVYDEVEEMAVDMGVDLRATLGKKSKKKKESVVRFAEPDVLGFRQQQV